MRDSSRVWLLVPVLAVVLLVWVHGARIRRVDFVTGLDRDATPGLPGRTLIVPGHRGESYGLISQVQQMLREGDWRMRWVEYDNAPLGRAVHGPSPIRWYLALLARIDHAVFGRPLDAAVERAAVYAEPVLHGLILVGATAVAAWQFGPVIAALLSLGLAALFPFAAGFVAGAPVNSTLTLACVLAELLALLVGFRGLAAGAPAAGRWFLFAGIAGGCGLWIDPFSQIVLAAGLLVGTVPTLGSGMMSDEIRARLPSLWRRWGVAGAITALLAYLVDFFPADLGHWWLEYVHPVHALAWLGCGEVLARLSGRCRGQGWSGRDRLALAVAALAVAVLPVAVWLTDVYVLPHGRSDLQLTGLPGAAMAPDAIAWFQERGIQFWATLLPLLALLPAIRRMFVGGIDPFRRMFLMLASGTLATTVLAASFYLRWWLQVDIVLLIVLVAATTVFGVERPSGASRWAVPGFCLLLLPGLAQLLPRSAAQIPVVEVNAMLEKDLARWLSRRAAGNPEAVVWAPPEATVALHYFGGLRGIGTFAPENTEGLTAAVRIARAASAPEALALLQRRGVTHLVLPSWDPYFDGIAAATGNAGAGTFVDTLRAGELPSWLRPVAYQFRRIAGIEDYHVLVCEVVDEQEEITALSRQAEYFAEMGRLDEAGRIAETLRRFPADVGALAARAQVYAATGDNTRRTQVVADLGKRLGAGADRYLAWDRRVSLAIVLARERDGERAYAQARRCVAEMNPERLRTLNPGMLLNLQRLLSALELPIPDPALQTLARDLLPFELRQTL